MGFLGFGLFFLIFIIIIGVKGYQLFLRAKELQYLIRYGLDSTGTVISKRLKRAGSKGRSSAIRYEFPGPFGEKFTREVLVSQQEYDRHEVGSPIEIIYHPEKPKVSATKQLLAIIKEKQFPGLGP